MAASASSFSTGITSPSAPAIAGAGGTAPTAPITYFIGVPTLVDPFNEILKASSLEGRVSVLLDPACAKEGYVTCGRDWRVTLLDGTQLLPFSLEEDDLWLAFRSLLPKENKSIILDGVTAGTGLGVQKAYHDRALEIATEHRIPVQQGRTCLEGGNCLLFKAKDGSPRALVGVLSIALSLVALEKQGFFEEKTEELEAKKASITHVEKEYYRFAKNRALTSEFMPYYLDVMKAKRNGDSETQAKIHAEMMGKFGGIKGVTEELLEDIEEEVEFTHYAADALDVKAKWEMTKELIAKELHVPLEFIAFLPQLKYHIDFHVFINNAGQVFIHDESLAKASLDCCTANTSTEAELITLYKEASASKMDESLAWRDAAAKAITSIGCEVVLVPGVYEDKENYHPLNFMNALVLHDDTRNILCTSSSMLSSLNEAFASAVCMHATATKIAGLDSFIMTDLLRHVKAGVHCVTWEKHSSTHVSSSLEKK